MRSNPRHDNCWLKTKIQSPLGWLCRQEIFAGAIPRPLSTLPNPHHTTTLPNLTTPNARCMRSGTIIVLPNSQRHQVLIKCHIAMYCLINQLRVALRSHVILLNRGLSSKLCVLLQLVSHFPTAGAPRPKPGSYQPQYGEQPQPSPPAADWLQPTAILREPHSSIIEAHPLHSTRTRPNTFMPSSSDCSQIRADRCTGAQTVGAALSVRACLCCSGVLAVSTGPSMVMLKIPIARSNNCCDDQKNRVLSYMR